MAFSTAAMALRGEALAKPDTAGFEDAKKYDVRGMLGVRYGLRAVELLSNFTRSRQRIPCMLGS
jgi:hypothetical protein